MELKRLTLNTEIKELLGIVCFDVTAYDVNNICEGDNIHDQSVYAQITQSSILFNTFLDEHEIDRNVKWSLTAKLDVWFDQHVCKETGQINSVYLDTEYLDTHSSLDEVLLALDGSTITCEEMDAIPVLKEFASNLFNKELLQKLLDEVYVPKCNAPNFQIVEATMKDNGEVFKSYYGIYSKNPLNTAEDYQAISKSLAFNSQYGACFDAKNHIDSETGLITTPYNLIPISTADIDFDRGYSLIDVNILSSDQAEALQASDNHKIVTHIYESRSRQFTT